MDTNDSLRVASLWHSMHAISQQLSPTTGCSGIELLEADTFDLHCFQSLTGIFFPFINCLNAVFFNRWAFLHCRDNSIYKRIWMEIMKGKFRKRMQFEEQSWLVKCTLALPFVLWREILASNVIYVHFPFNYNPR